MQGPDVAPSTFTEHARFLRALARGLLADSSQAEDVVQETWVAAFRHPPRHTASLRAWLARITRNLAFRSRRAAKRRAHHERRAARPEGVSSASELAERIELQRRVLAAVESLEEPFRAALIYRYYDDLSPSEVAARLSVPVKTVKSRLHRALQKLRARLDRECGGERAWSALLLPMVLPKRSSAAATTAGAIATGGIALTMKKAVLLLAALLLGTALVVWQAAPPRGDSARSPSRPGAREADSPPSASRPGEVEGVASGSTLPVLGEKDAIPALTFAGRVVDSSGNGVPGALVRLLYWQAIPGEAGSFTSEILRREYERHESPRVRSRKDGYFRLDRPYPSKSYLHVQADGFPPVVTPAKEPGQFILIVMGERAPLIVRVADPAGTPVSRATVRLVTDSGRDRARQVVAEAVTDTNGSARMPAPRDGGLRIEVDPKDPALGFVERPVRADAPEVAVEVPRLGALTIRILDSRTETPVPDSYVSFCQRGEHGVPIERRRFRADADGVVRASRQSSGVPLYATAPGYQVSHVGGEQVTITPAMGIDGVVLDERGQPVPDVPVLVTMPRTGPFVRAHSGLPVVAAWSDAQGAFALECRALPGSREPGVRSLIALHDAHAPAIVDSILVRAGRRTSVKLRFPVPATLRIVVAGSENRPLRRQWLTVRRRIPAASPRSPDTRGGGVDLVALRPPHALVTDAQGMAEATLLPPGDYVIRSENTRADARLTEGETTTVRIAKGVRASVSGRVIDAAGKPVRRIWVGIHGPSSARMETDAEGRFEFLDLTPGRHWVGVGARLGGNICTVEVPATPGEEVLIRLPAGPAKLRVTVGSGGERLQYLLGTVSGGRLPKRGLWSAPSKGLINTPGFTPGAGILVVRSPGGGWVAVPFEAAALQTTDIDVRLPKAGSVKCRVAEGAARPGRVRLIRIDDFTRAWSPQTVLLWSRLRSRIAEVPPTAAVQGSFAFDGLSPGTYRIACDVGSRRIESATFRVVAGKTTTIEIPK